jgi:acetyl-CoA acetyltransferase
VQEAILNRVFVHHPVKQFSGSKEPLRDLLARALDGLLNQGVEEVDRVLIVSAHPLELADISPAELAEAGAEYLKSRGKSWPVEFFANPSIYVESAHLGASAAGAALFHEGVRRVATGECRTLAVIGLEQMRLTDRATTTRALRSLIHDEEKKVGLTMPALGALLERRLTADYPGLEKALTDLTFANRRLAEANPRAHIRKRFNRADAETDYNPMVSEPLRLWGVAPTSTGYAALVLSREPDDSSIHVQVAGLGSGIDKLAVSRRTVLRYSRATRQAMGELASTFGEEPRKIGSMLSYAEIHDAFPIIEFLGLVDCGLTGEIDPVMAVRRGDFFPGGRLPVNLSGGVMGGHPLGATGLGQVVELYLQATGRAEVSVPVRYPHYSLAFNVGGALTYNFVSLLAASHNPHEIGPFRISVGPPFRREDFDLSYTPTVRARVWLPVLSHTRLHVPPPGFVSPWTIVLVEGKGGAEFVAGNGKALARGERVRLQRRDDGAYELAEAA